jgi:CRP/FNR family transcriptional regulator
MTDPPKLQTDAGEALAQIPYIRTLPPADRSRLAALCEPRRVPRGAEVFAEGDAPAGVFLILGGRVKLVRASLDGREQILHEEGPGATLAEVPVFDGGGYVASAVAVDDSDLLFVPRAPLLELVERHPPSSRAVIAILAARVRRFAGLVEDLSLRGVVGRTAAYLQRELGRSGSLEIELPPTRDELAAHIGTVREQVSRALSQLARDGAIELKGRRVRVADPARLHAYFE